MALAKVFSWWFVAQFATPTIVDNIPQLDAWFASAVMGILWYKIIETLLSWDFIAELKRVLIMWLQK
jgi:hypothetical protein